MLSSWWFSFHFRFSITSDSSKGSLWLFQARQQWRIHFSFSYSATFFFFSCLNIPLLGKSKIPYLTNFHLVYDDNFWPKLVELSTFQSRIHFYSLLFFWTASGLRTTKSVIIIIITDDILLLVPRFEAPIPPEKNCMNRNWIRVILTRFTSVLNKRILTQRYISFCSNYQQKLLDVDIVSLLTNKINVNNLITATCDI